jgi:hypothetical protein
MGDTARSWEVLIGQAIIAETGERLIVSGVDDAAVLLQSADTPHRHTITMQELRGATRLWRELGRAPSPDDIREEGAARANAAYLVPLLVALRRVPEPPAWLQFTPEGSEQATEA